MCRQALFNKEGVKLIDKEYGGLENFLSFLILERGGNGCGLTLVKDSQIIYFKKGVDYSLEEIATTMRKFDYDYAHFHTRLATIGSITDSNCHPFVYSLSFEACMNGTEDDYTQPRSADYKYDMTDAERVIKEFFESGMKPQEFLLSGKFSSAFSGFYDGKPFVATNSKNLIRILSKDDALVFASDFPWRYDGKNIYDLTKGNFYWDEDTKISFDEVTPAKSGRTCIIDGLARQILDKRNDTLITMLSQKLKKSEDEVKSFIVEDFLNKCDEEDILTKGNVRVRK